MKKPAKIIGIVLIVCACVTFWGTFLYSYANDILNTWYITEDISDYGRIEGNHNNEIPEEFLMDFFPQKIEPHYDVIKYKYKATNRCKYNCEMYLEFTISDSEQFRACVDQLTSGLIAQTFPYDPKYDDYVINNHLFVDPESKNSIDGRGEYYFLSNGARMGRILVCEDEQRIICTGIIIYSCCGGFTDYYDFYDWFGITPLEYSQRFCSDEAWEHE